MQFIYVTRKELGTCPAAVDMDRGIIEINADEWDKYDELQRRFLVAHEEAHYTRQTDDEKEADRVALYKIAGTGKKSLTRCIETLYKCGVLDQSRLDAIYHEALKIDAQHGNTEAAKELAEIYKRKNKAFMVNPYPQAPKEQEWKLQLKAEAELRKSYIDGILKKGNDLFDKWQAINTTDYFVLGGYRISFTNILLAIIAFLMIKNLKRM